LVAYRTFRPPGAGASLGPIFTARLPALETSCPGSSAGAQALGRKTRAEGDLVPLNARK